MKWHKNLPWALFCLRELMPFKRNVEHTVHKEVLKIDSKQAVAVLNNTYSNIINKQFHEFQSLLQGVISHGENGLCLFFPCNHFIPH